MREDAELRTLDSEEIFKLTAGARDGCRQTSFNKSVKAGGSSGRLAMTNQVRTESPSQEPSVFGHVQARAWAGQVRHLPIYPVRRSEDGLLVRFV